LLGYVSDRIVDSGIKAPRALSIATKKQPKSQGGWQIMNHLSTTLLTPFGTSNSLLGNSMRCPTRHAFESKLQRSHPAEMADS